MPRLDSVGYLLYSKTYCFEIFCDSKFCSQQLLLALRGASSHSEARERMKLENMFFIIRIISYLSFSLSLSLW